MFNKPLARIIQNCTNSKLGWF